MKIQGSIKDIEECGLQWSRNRLMRKSQVPDLKPY